MGGLGRLGVKSVACAGQGKPFAGLSRPENGCFSAPPGAKVFLRAPCDMRHAACTHGPIGRVRGPRPVPRAPRDRPLCFGHARMHRACACAIAPLRASQWSLRLSQYVVLYVRTSCVIMIRARPGPAGGRCQGTLISGQCKLLLIIRLPGDAGPGYRNIDGPGMRHMSDEISLL